MRKLRGVDSEPRPLDVPRDEAELARSRSGDPHPLQQLRPALLRGKHPHDRPRLRIADRLRPHHGDDLLYPSVGGGLGDDLLPHEPRRPRQEDMQAWAPATEAQRRLRVALQPLHPRSHLRLAEVGRLTKAEVRAAAHHTQQPLRP
jgi:hypothetical protein